MSSTRQRRTKTSTHISVTLDNETYSYIHDRAVINNLSFSAQLAVLLKKFIKLEESIRE